MTEIEVHVQVMDLTKPGVEGNVAFFNGLKPYIAEPLDIDDYRAKLIPHIAEAYEGNLYNSLISANKFIFDDVIETKPSIGRQASMLRVR